ncbi:MAG: alpha/beta fold hydrolase [Pseudomonadota bacterium]
MSAPVWLRYSLSVLSRIDPNRAAALAHAFFRKPSMTARCDEQDRRRLAEAGALMSALGRTRLTKIRGKRIKSYHFAGDGAGAVLLLHGWSGDSRAMGAFIEPLLDAGYEITAIDFPAHGGSSGTETDAVEAAVATRRLLAGTQTKPDHIIAHSFGGGVAGLLVDRGFAPRGFISIASPTRLSLIIDDLCAGLGLSAAARRRFEALIQKDLGRSIQACDAELVWKCQETDILAIHSPDDMRVPFAHAQHFAALPNVTLKALAWVDHCEIVYDPRTVHAALAHIQRVDEARRGPLAA